VGRRKRARCLAEPAPLLRIREQVADLVDQTLAVDGGFTAR
jgi:hypothetical protein